MTRTLLVVALLATVSPAGAQHWYRGNTHAHTLNSDGDSPPGDVVRWYREHGYQFTFITDHEFITDVEPLNGLYGAAGRFLVLSGQEVSQRVDDPAHPDGVRQAHVNALGVTRVIWPVGERYVARGMTIADTYARNGAAIAAAGGIMQVNHPNFRWSVPMEQLFRLPDSTLFEIWNGHPMIYNQGGTDSLGHVMPSSEALWDTLLTRGRLLWGIGDDDSHSFRPEHADDPDEARPGRAWIMVRADTLAPEAILRAIRRGDFYASTGVTLSAYQADPASIRLVITQSLDRRYRTDFIGAGGRVLATIHGTRAEYRLRGDEGYVRARVTDSSGRMAWTQPVRLD